MEVEELGTTGVGGGPVFAAVIFGVPTGLLVGDEIAGIAGEIPTVFTEIDFEPTVPALVGEEEGCGSARSPNPFVFGVGETTVVTFGETVFGEADRLPDSGSGLWRLDMV